MMATSPSEICLDCKPHSYAVLLKSFGEQTADQTQKIEEFLAHLEEERLKIDAFKRELPLCMQLLSNAMETSRQQLQGYLANQGQRPVLEEFIPLKHSSTEGSEKTSNMSDKANWMTSVQLWSQASDGTKSQSSIASPKKTDTGFSVSPPKLDLENKQRNGGAFLPFSKDRNLYPSPTLRALPDLTLASNDKEMEDRKCLETNSRGETCVKGGNGATTTEQGKGGGTAADSQIATNNTTTPTTNQTHRKARRCWSPDLHRRFVNALQMLGGSQVATPKQIRELMKVDGLTNDEVKSHLQKYRLHTRRPCPSPQPTAAPRLVVLGGIWVPQEYAAAHGAPQAALYGAHPTTHASLHYCAPPVPQEFYPAPAPPSQPHHQLHHHNLHHQLHMYKLPSQTHSSPDSDVRGTGDRSESIEDGKSESSSWKADSGGENGGDRKILVLREDGEESNGSDITLKF
ncbi:unnamed protein product [Ilex paraguariensis]|uniref:HTH myb-type domain-containing protein n=1 Tax=Ilex paraguariensis TaxID=185542 RepID=A0ABC8TS42_9AQUA